MLLSRPSRTICIVALVLVLTAAVASRATASSATPPAQPNIIFIFSDDHAAQAIGCYGSRINTTPNLDRIAASGMRFRNCFCTNSICGPSRAVVLTGKHSHINGFRDNNNSRFNGAQQTFPKLFQAAGYQSAIVGKWHLVSDPTGFDTWKILVGQGTYYNPILIENGRRVRHEGYATDIITDVALDFLKSRDPQKPFVLMYQHKAPHREWEPALRHLHLFDDVDIPEPPTLFDDYSGRGTAAHVQQMEVVRDLNKLDLKLVTPKDLNPAQLEQWNAAYEPQNRAFRDAHLSGRELAHWKYERYIKDYLRCVAGIDENVGRLLDYLDQSGLAKNTVVIYSSDQGFYLGEHGWFDKRFMYEESLRMPLLIRWPGVTQPGSVSDALVSNLDFAETFLQMAGASVPADMQGQSLVPVLKGDGATPADWRKSLYYHYYEYPAVHMVNKHEGVRTGRYKLINFYELGEWELYDLEKDPHEMHSVYADPAYAATVRELKTELARLRDVYRVPPNTSQRPAPKAAPGVK
jgi:arylsulfatase A-like enzyme